MDSNIDYDINKNPFKFFKNKQQSRVRFENLHNNSQQESSNQFNKKHLFWQMYPNLIIFMEKFENLFVVEIQKLDQFSSEQEKLMVYEKMFRHLITINKSTLDSEFNGSFAEEWDNLEKVHDGTTQRHMIIATILLYTEINFLLCNEENKPLLSEYDRNILLWAILLHDISKHVILNKSLGEDFQENRSDKIHPFKSGALALKIFHKINFIQTNNMNDSEKQIEKIIEEIYSILTESVEMRYMERKKSTLLLHDFQKLPELKELFETLRKYNNDWIIDVVTLITFHQSFPNMEQHMNLPLLEEPMIKKFFSPRLVELMRIIMINDSCAHSLFTKPPFSKEINNNLDSVSDLFN
jgi:hypothetical protein